MGPDWLLDNLFLLRGLADSTRPMRGPSGRPKRNYPSVSIHLISIRRQRKELGQESPSGTPNAKCLLPGLLFKPESSSLPTQQTHQQDTPQTVQQVTCNFPGNLRMTQVRSWRSKSVCSQSICSSPHKNPMCPIPKANTPEEHSFTSSPAHLLLILSERPSRKQKPGG